MSSTSWRTALNASQQKDIGDNYGGLFANIESLIQGGLRSVLESVVGSANVSSGESVVAQHGQVRVFMVQAKC